MTVTPKSIRDHPERFRFLGLKKSRDESIDVCREIKTKLLIQVEKRGYVELDRAALKGLSVLRGAVHRPLA
jgi:hypothetical protein